MQKIMFKGLAKDDSTLKSLNIKNGDKLMLIGSKPQDVAQVMQKPVVTQTKSSSLVTGTKKEPLSNELPHKKVIEKYGKPDDCMPGDKTLLVILKNYYFFFKLTLGALLNQTFGE